MIPNQYTSDALLRIMYEPGSYLHQDYCAIDYAQVPPLLRSAWNQSLIARWHLALPDGQHLVLPQVLQRGWSRLPDSIRLYGIISLDLPGLLSSQPWLFSHSDVDFWHRFRPISGVDYHAFATGRRIASEDIYALGVRQLLTFIQAFHPLFTQRAKLLFARHLIQRQPQSSPLLPYNLLEKVLHYALG